MVPPHRIELWTSPLPRARSTPELRRHPAALCHRRPQRARRHGLAALIRDRQDGSRSRAVRLGGNMTGEQGKETSEGKPVPGAKKAAREARLAEALRRNLLKRKDQQRARIVEDDAGVASDC